MLFLVAISIGAETPPFGLVLFALKGVIPTASITEIYKAAIPFVVLEPHIAGNPRRLPPDRALPAEPCAGDLTARIAHFKELRT